MRGFFERRRREGFAENAKEDKEKTALVSMPIQKHFRYSFLYSFGIFFFAPFAKPSRPLRSKNPRIEKLKAQQSTPAPP
jgi:hypothetical protein